MFPEINMNLIVDLAIIIVPFLILIILIIKFVVPKKPALGIGLAIGGGLLGAWLVKRKLNNAFDVEKQLALHNEKMAQFKDKQKQRSQAVLANKQIIDTLEKQKKKLIAAGKEHSTELKLIDAELEERKVLNKEILEDADAFLESTEKRSTSRKNLLKEYQDEGTSISADAPVTTVPNRGTSEEPDIEISGHRIIKV